MKRILPFLTICVFLASCEPEKVKTKITEPVVNLPEALAYPLEMDMSKNATEFIANCQTCHTPRYIEMQPDFPRKTWTKIVDKMIHSYGAQIDSVTAVKIVDYLVWVQGN